MPILRVRRRAIERIGSRAWGRCRRPGARPPSRAPWAGGRQCVQISDAEDRLVLRLRGNPEADRAQVVAQVELPGWLDAGEYALSSHYESARASASANRTTSRFALIAADRETPSARQR